MLYFFFKILLTIPFMTLFRPRIKGWKHLFFRGKGILVSNHHDLSDPIYIAFISPRVIHFMAKQELFESKVGAMFMRSFLAFPVYRKHADMASLKQAMSVLEKGRVFGIFPEGRRSVTGELDEFEKGAAFLALRCNAPIIPLYSDPDAPKRLRLRMIAGEPIDVEAVAKQYGGRSVDVVTDCIRDRMQEMKVEMLKWNKAL